jgi:hypothetical protein
LEMVPTLYFSVLTRDKIIIFGHKFLAMPKKAYVSPSGVHSFIFSWETARKFIFNQSKSFRPICSFFAFKLS